MKWNGVPTPCETFSYGEVEDYGVTISSSRTTTNRIPTIKIDGQRAIRKKFIQR